MNIRYTKVGDLNDQNLKIKGVGYSRQDIIFPMKEFETRLQKVRDQIAARGLDAALITTPENIFYLSGYQTLGYWYFQAMIVPLNQEPFMVLRGLEQPNVDARTYLSHSYVYSDNEEPIDVLRDSFKEEGLVGKKIGVELHSYFLRNTEFAEVKQKIKETEWVDVSGMVEELRMVKSTLEIKKLKNAGIFTHMGMIEGLKEAQIGKTENDIAAGFYHGALDAGGHYMAMPPFVASGPRSYLAHATFMNRTLQPNEFILFEGAGCFERYHAPTMRTIYLGRPEPWYKEVEAILAEALRTTVKSMKPGVTASDVDAVNQSVIQKNTFGGQQTSRSGYSVGTAFAPDWGEGHMISLIKGNETVLQENMVFHVLSYIEIPESKFAKESRFGISDTVFVTPEGGKSVVNLPYEIKFLEEGF
jgi:Xaa-Pro dipeptidase